MQPLNILHVMRAPAGGLFRHVADLARGQASHGHKVGLIVDATIGAARAETVLTELAAFLALGVTRIPMSRHLGLSDIAARNAVRARAQTTAADIVHGHGAKGGAYARLLPAGQAIRVYTPHGGSLHYRPTSPLGLIYLGLERVLMPRTELFLFESAYGRDVFQARVGKPAATIRVVHNGVTPEEFVPVEPVPDATDLLFIGELRMLKGVDVLIEALGLLARDGRTLSATIVGEGPDADRFRARADALGLTTHVCFVGPLPARTAFARGRVLVVPSRAESLPYIVLEAGAASVPMIATSVGGIPEIFGSDARRLVAPDDAAALAAAIRRALAEPATTRTEAARLRARIQAAFSLDSMTNQIFAAYGKALAGRRPRLLRSH